MIDTHSHLDFESFDQDREKVIADFFDERGRAIIKEAETATDDNAIDFLIFDKQN